MQRTVWLTGILPFVLIISPVLTVLLTMPLLWLYRRAVLRSMLLAAGSASPVAAPPSAAPVGPPLDVQTVGVEAATPAAAAYRGGQRSHRRFALVHALAGLAYAAVFTIVWMTWVTPGFILTRALWFLAVYSWLVVIVLGLVAAASRAGRFTIAGGYAAVVLAVAAYALARNPELAPRELATFWLTANAPETVLVLTFLVRRLRAVGPLVLAFVTAGVIGALFGVQLVGVDESVLRRVANVGFAAGLGATGVFIAWTCEASHRPTPAACTRSVGCSTTSRSRASCSSSTRRPTTDSCA
jgi:hypothetical protein